MSVEASFGKRNIPFYIFFSFIIEIDDIQVLQCLTNKTQKKHAVTDKCFGSIYEYV